MQLDFLFYVLVECISALNFHCGLLAFILFLTVCCPHFLFWFFYRLRNNLKYTCKKMKNFTNSAIYHDNDPRNGNYEKDRMGSQRGKDIAQFRKQDLTSCPTPS